MQQVDSLERDQAQQEQAGLPPQEGERSGPLSRRREGRINGLGGTGHLATLVERMTRFTLVARVASKESDCVMSAIIGMPAGIPKDMLKS